MATPLSTSVPAWSIQLIAELDAADQRARELVIGLTREQLNWHPKPGMWSVGQCLEHLAIANEVYLPPISGALARQPVRVVQEITPGWFAGWFIHSYIEPSLKGKHVSAPNRIVPGRQVELSVLDRFIRSNQLARELVRHASGYDVNRIRFRNPFVPVIRFTVGTGLQIVARHQSRHLLQAERVTQSSCFPR